MLELVPSTSLQLRLSPNFEHHYYGTNLTFGDKRFVKFTLDALE